MGKPGGSHVPSPSAESIGGTEPTEGSETSQYPQEEKENSIPRVAASEKGTAQTRARLRAEGLRDPEGVSREVTNQHANRTDWKVGPQKVTVL